MTREKIFGISLITMVLVITLFIFNNAETIDNKTVTPNTETKKEASEVQTIEATAELTNYFATLEDLLSKADLVVEGRVKSQETIVHGEMPFTISEVKVKSNLLEGKTKDTIKVIETGGVYSPIGRDGKKLPKVNMKLNGVDTLKINEHVLLFLEEFDGPQLEGGYVPVGAYQGKFKVKDGTTLEQITDVENQLSPEEMKQIKTIGKLKEKIK
ncbi:hypothetical protein NC797_06745 [Aquibacillus sp. 3ASR75-11]|uniref:Uncharacterized protein n=1 Tax=Terrihalobacillus insolitus TaxID=2950438 RepID=A0A9X3WR19_9BACI|nr:hypothetical protein [Terrihalobacillus insolitus]MDC3414682.1 hypothetical protein [Terrihalobacillus insolitus]MDC3424205.1 hypothetical protein [Terrihalobacillus insolitus]